MLAKLCSEHKVAYFLRMLGATGSAWPRKLLKKNGSPLGGHTIQLTVATDGSRPEKVISSQHHASTAGDIREHNASSPPRPKRE